MSGKLVFLVAVSMAVLMSVTTSPIKEKDIEAIIFRLAEMKNDLHLEVRDLDELGGGYLLKKKSLDPLGGGHLIRSLDTLGHGYLVRSLDTLGGAAGNDSERHHYSVRRGGGDGEEITDSDKNRLIYDYFVNPIGRYHGKRDFDEIDRYGFDSFAGPGGHAEKRNFDEIDRYGFSKRMMSKRPAIKRNLDEIDRYGFSSLKKRAAI